MNGKYKIGEVVLGSWTLVRLLGEGSYGKVYEAHREDFGTTYKAAIKIMTIPPSQSEVKSARAEGMDEASVTAYFRSMVEDVVQEFALMSRLKGTANIVGYEDHAVIPLSEGVGWDVLIRMELLTPMLNYMESNRMTRSDIIKLGIDICHALELCQRYNIIHRDIKPENIFISDTGDYKLGDFGVARTLEKTTGGLSKKGTYTYMAPEIYRDEKYGSTVDIYSLGIVLYRLLNNNRAPFLPAPPQPITHSERERALVRRISGEALPPPANAEGRLGEIVLKACAYDPKDRYSSPLQMRQELEAIWYHQGEDAAIYGRSGQIAVDRRDYTRPGEDSEATVYEPRPSAPKGGEPVYTPRGEKSEAKEQLPVSPAAPKKKKKTGLIAAAVAALALLAVLLIVFLKPKDSSSAPTGAPVSLRPAADTGAQAVGSLSLERPSLPDGSIAEAIHSHGQFLAAGPYQTVAVRKDGTVAVEVSQDENQSDYHLGDVGSWQDIGGVAASEYWTFGIRNDGRVLISGYDFYDDSYLVTFKDEVIPWTEIVKVDCDGGHLATLIGNDMLMSEIYHVVGLRYDGTVVAAGDERYGECLVSDWTEIVDVAAGWRHTVGLKADGTVVAVGSNEDGQCEVSDWTDVVQVEAGKYSTVALKADGTVLVAGDGGQTDPGLKETVAGWKNVVRVQAGHDLGIDADFVLAVCDDGTVRFAAPYWIPWPLPASQASDGVLCAGSSWGYFVYVDGSGSAHGFSNNPEFDWGDRVASLLWTDLMLPGDPVEGFSEANGPTDAAAAEILARPSRQGSIAEVIRSYGRVLDAGPYHLVVLMADGTVVARTGDFSYHGEDLTDSWEDVGGVAAGEYWTFGVKNDGTVYACGDKNSANNMLKAVSAWTDIVKIESSGSFYIHDSRNNPVLIYHTVGLRYDGTVVSAGNDKYGEGQVGSWTDMVDVAAGFAHTLGLRADGTVVAVGSNDFGQCDVSEWTDIVQIAAGKYHSVGLKADGSVVVTGIGGQSGISRSAVSMLHGVRRISLANELGQDNDYLMAIMADGSVISINMEMPSELKESGNVVACAGGSFGYTSWMDDQGNVWGAARMPYLEAEDHSLDSRYGTPLLSGGMLPS